MITPKFGQGLRSESLHKKVPSREPLQPGIEERPRSLHDMHLENAVTRNRLKHTNEVVNQYMHWFDEEVFEQCPTWEACEQAGKIPRLDLERYFGKANENGPGNYAQSVKYSVGRRVVAKILAGAESDGDIRKAIDNFPMSERHRASRQHLYNNYTVRPLVYNFRGSKSCTTC